ncbi:MAG: hypothetical protein V4555_17975 [Acidobacteriota bacterium]
MSGNLNRLRNPLCYSRSKLTEVRTMSFSSARDIQVFPCPNCHETINTSQQQCAFCGTPVDPAAAQASATRTTLISQACSDASYLKTMAICGAGFFALRMLPILGFVGTFGFLFLSVALPVMSVRWWYKFGNILTDDPDFRAARRSTILATSAGAFYLLLSFIWLGMLLLFSLHK